jgi:FlaA1/EpsC-like NDP-sugar epimerase
MSIVVTGAGGYIGSALVRAVAQAGPRCIVLLDSSEHNLFEIDRQMNSAFSSVPRAAVLGSVDDRRLVDDVFRRFRPDIVYHAGAFKHVPLLESNPFAAVRNNAIGTWVLAQAAVRHGASSMVLVSTDKAVNPHSIMGASKRIAELATVAMSGPSCRMNAVRLGNVKGSPGSVIPLFLKQIADGGPVMVTHPDASRWFMSRDEAVDAIITAGNVACGGRILLPELSERVRITELAQSLMAPRELPIVFGGLRPGDKLTEELISDKETEEGEADGLRVITTRRLTCGNLADLMERLSDCIDHAGLVREIRTVVPEYVPSRLLQ